MNITLIGGGQLGKQLYRNLIDQVEVKLFQWVVRSAKEGKTLEGIPIVNKINKINKIDLYLLAISDKAISVVAEKLPADSFVVHTAGGVPLNRICQKRAGVLYPIQTFSEGRYINFSEVPIGLESKKAQDLPLLKKIAKGLGSKSFIMNSKQREQLHLAAVLVNNFTNYFFTEAALICKENNLPFELLKPLIKETAIKLDVLSPQNAQTGPAIRKDQETITKHLKSIQNPKLHEIYKVLTSAIQKNNEQ